MNKGFVCLNRSIMDTPLWEKPPYYLKIYLYLLMQASFADGNGFKRGESITCVQTLERICASGMGGSKTAPSRDAVRRALRYLGSGEANLSLNVVSEGKDRVRVSFLQYDKITNSKQVEESVKNASGASQQVSTIIYNKDNQTNHVNRVNSRPAKRVQPSKFNNFTSKPRDMDKIRKKAKLKIQEMLERTEQNEEGYVKDNA